MSWWGWLLLAAYLAGCGIAMPRIGYVLAHHMGGHIDGIDGIDVAMGLIFGAFIAPFWPVVFPGYRWYQYTQHCEKTMSWLLVAPRPVRKRAELERREREVMEREHRIHMLERDLGVGRDR